MSAVNVDNTARRGPGLVAAVAVVIAAAWVSSFHLNRMPFYDEAWILDAVTAPTLNEGLATLVRDRQGAAVLFTAALHALPADGAHQPAAWRMFVAGAGCATVLLAAWLAARWSRSFALGALTAVTLLLPPLYVGYLTEIKQYAFDPVVALLLVITAERWLTAPPQRAARAGWMWFASALLAAMLTFAGWFAVVGTAAVLFIVMVLRRSPELKRLIAFGAGAAAILAVNYFFFVRHLAGNEMLEHHWRYYYVPFKLSWPADVWTTCSNFLQISWHGMPRVQSLPLMPIAAAGWLLWMWRHPFSALAALATTLDTFAASGLHKWPMGFRLNLHIFVFLHMAMLAGPLIAATWLRERWLKRAARNLADNTPAISIASINAWPTWLGWTAALLLAPASYVAIQRSAEQDYEVAAVGPLLDAVGAQAKREDVVILMVGTNTVQQIWPRKIEAMVRDAPWASPESVEVNYKSQMQLSAGKRVWIAVGHHDDTQKEAMQKLGESLSAHGRLTQTWAQRMVALYCFEPKTSTAEHP